ncbi:MAG: PBP1A family penicillin-binding protein [Campylobacteraceae bacterium]|nr:PBP1A family penicillin-binding protein [Campylobacteraceae bacterium]
MKYVLGFFAILSLSIASWIIYLYANIRFDIDKVVNYNPPLTTQFFDKNGELVANIFQKEHRLYVKYDDIPPRIIEGLIAIEDTMFFEHNGINLDAISRAIIKDIKARKLVEGASTLSQQLVKTLVLSREKKILRKIKEILLTLRLETILSKEEILERYLNQVYFGHGYYGIKTAALGYFKKELYELSLKEIAMLVGLPRAPSFYDPTRNLKFSLARANQVIRRMHKIGWINKSEYDASITAVPIVYKQTLTQNKAPYIIDYALKQLKNNVKDLRSSGYKVQLTIDLKAQQIAREGLNHAYALILKRDVKSFERDKIAYVKAKEKIRKLKIKVENGSFTVPSKYDQEGKEREDWINPLSIPKKLAYIKEREVINEETGISTIELISTRVDTLNAAQITIESSSGKIITMLGGIDYKKSSFNRVIQSQRQPGSSIKPFLYQKALDSGYSPATNLIDISRTYSYKDGDEEKQWKPRNYVEGNYKGFVPLREALVHSRNLATINLVTDLGIDVVYNGLKEYGMKKIPFDLSITLGSFAMSPYKLTQAYSMFSNNGVQVKPYLISSIINKNNTKINFEKEETYITSPAQTYLMTSILYDTVNRGTGRMARVKGLDVAGKTGTTNNNVDAWFAGYTPSMLTITWFGNDDNKPMGRRETGGRAAGPAFAYFYKNYLKIHPEIPRKFIKPEEVRTSIINGKKEYFTDISKLPEVIRVPQNEEEQIEF